jgi:hypothetical protein
MPHDDDHPSIEAAYPRSLRQVLAYLETNPLVCMHTRYARTLCKSHWLFSEMKSGVLWFEPKRRRNGQTEAARTGLTLINDNEYELSLEFLPTGFVYTRGLINIRIDYVDPMEL